MDTVENVSVTIAPGDAFAGGFLAGFILLNGESHAIIVAPKAQGEHDDAALLDSRANVPGALSFFDGHANTAALAEAGSELAKWAQGLAIGGFNDWYLPSRDELEICYRALKPTTEQNYCWRGDNPSSVPVGYAYSLDAPAQTSVDAFKAGGAEAFDDTWYWTSTQYAGSESYAWGQDFTSGYQGSGLKGSELRARAVRRVKT
jgi:hypothetical protein